MKPMKVSRKKSLIHLGWRLFTHSSTSTNPELFRLCRFFAQKNTAKNPLHEFSPENRPFALQGNYPPWNKQFAPENWWLVQMIFFLGCPCFRCYVSFREGSIPTAFTGLKTSTALPTFGASVLTWKISWKSQVQWLIQWWLKKLLIHEKIIYIYIHQTNISTTFLNEYIYIRLYMYVHIKYIYQVTSNIHVHCSKTHWA